MATAQNWSELPVDLLDQIAKPLILYADYIRLRAVCVSWQSALPKIPNHLPRQFPLLMIPNEKESDTHRDFFNLAENKYYRFDFPFEVHNKVLCGSSHGWLVTFDPNTLSISLYNPFTKALIKLPSFPAFDYEEIEYLNKVVLSSSPSSSDFVAIAVIKYSRNMRFCRCRDESWAILREPNGVPLCFFADIIFYKQQIVAVRFDGEVVIMEVIDNNGNSIPKIKINQILVPPYSITFDDTIHLVESDDELFIVSRLVGFTHTDNYFNYHCIATGFSVYKLDLSKNSKGVVNAEYSEVKSLGDRMLILDVGPSSYFSTHDFPGCRRNCIYFTDDLWTGHWEGLACESCVALFDMGDKRIKPLPCYPQELFSPPSVWVTPSPI
ncbi:putative F-box protein At1g65770 [Macadamia integrifolia]|uniref:putative F-box protein At1g65770 n=1 Tax=Macadamia integrifolia TaxID=60698 RepID=UPI001C4ED931|nr:putative F-box protein At1g65770 [Macadamia integrifolia]